MKELVNQKELAEMISLSDIREIEEDIE